MPSLLERLGGVAGIEALIRRFYHHMDTRPEAAKIRSMHRADHDEMVAKLTAFLGRGTRRIERAGDGFGRTILPLAHQRFAIGPEERDAWLGCLRAALDDRAVDAEATRLLMDAVAEIAEACRTDDEA